MRRALWAAAVLAAHAVAGPALALSCMRPDPASDFVGADASEDIWIIAEGVLSFDTALLPPRDRGVAPSADIDIPARFSGQSLSGGGFDRPFDATITLRLTCAGPWCGQAAPGQMIAFLKRTPEGHVLIADPCRTRVYPDASDAVRDQLVRCIRGETCTPADPFR